MKKLLISGIAIILSMILSCCTIVLPSQQSTPHTSSSQNASSHEVSSQSTSSQNSSSQNSSSQSSSYQSASSQSASSQSTSSQSTSSKSDSVKSASSASAESKAFSVEEEYDGDNVARIDGDSAIAYVITGPSVGLEKVHKIDSKNYYYSSGEMTDSFGNEYQGFHDFSSDAYAIFNLNQQYSKLTGTFVLDERTNSHTGYYAIVYVDGVSVLRTDTITKTMGEIAIEVDVTGASQLKIEVINTGGSVLYGLDLVEAELEKVG